jgi:hypothetical protein
VSEIEQLCRLIPGRYAMVQPLLLSGGMKWLVFVIAFASGCHAVGDTLDCLMSFDDEWKQDACESAHASDRAFERKERLDTERSAQRDHDADLRMREEYKASIGPCGNGDARACFVTALYEDRHGAPSVAVESRYRFACGSGIGRACFMAGSHERTLVSDDVIEKRSPRSIEARQLALASFTHGCALRDGESCRAGLDLDPTRIDLVETACAAHYGWACTMLGR